MRIAQLVETLDAGGAEGLAVDIANTLVDRGHESCLIVIDGSGPFQSRVDSRVHFVDLARPRETGFFLARIWYFLVTLRSLVLVAKEANLEVVQTHLPKANFFGLFLSRLVSLRIYPTIHNNREFDYGVRTSALLDYARRRAYRQMLSWCDGMVAVSAEVKLGMIQELGLDSSVLCQNIFEVANGVQLRPLPSTADRRASRERWGLGDDCPLIVGVGRLTDQKNFASLITALQEVSLTNSRWSCVIAGEGENRADLEAQIAACGLSEKVRLAGHVDNVGRLLDAADVFCLSSRYEGLPLVLLEAMAAGLPIAAYGIAGVVDVVTGGREGLLATPENSAELAEKLAQLLGSREQRRALGQAGRELVGSQYSFDGAVDKLEAIYRGEG